MAAMLDSAFLEWLRATTEARWADPDLRDAAQIGLGELAWQPRTRWRGSISESDLRIVESMFELRFPPAYRRFLATLHTPDPAMAATQARAGRLVRVEGRLFTDWTGATTPLIAAFERPLEGILRGVGLGRWHEAWGRRPSDERERVRTVRKLASKAPRLIPFAAQRYLVAVPGADDGPIIAIHGADASIVAPDLRAALLRELGLADPDGEAAAEVETQRIPFWSDVVEGLPWRPADVALGA